MTNQSIDIGHLFQGVLPPDEVRVGGFHRVSDPRHPETDAIVDIFGDTDAACCFLRFEPVAPGALELVITGSYSFNTLAAGGWSLLPTGGEQDVYWIPVPPTLRSLDAQGHILTHRIADTTGLNVSASSLGITLDVASGHVLDLVVWRFPAGESDLLQSLQQLNALERQRYFLWSSHTAYERPADLYLHLVHGHVYENHDVWPRYWRVCSELDAYALYVTLSGLLRATGKRLYALLRTQVVFSVIARQAEDGGWYHGEWTDGMESHYRLHAGGMHMLAAYFEETRDAVVGDALQKAAGFAAARTDRLDSGMWYLHDSLEQNKETLRQYPFRYAPSRALGKSESNLLVLNTHLDTNIAMERHRRVAGDGRHDALIESARATTRAILDLHPAEWLYRPLFRAIGLTFLPTERARTLPLHLRALKRIAWKYLVPQLPRIKVLFPRLVMPGGFIERDLAQYGLSVRYQPVNLMDLIRTRRLFDEAWVDDLLEECFAFTHDSGIKDRWKEFKCKEDDSLGFWAEALYHLCLAKPDALYRAWLAEVIMDLEDNGLGLSPSLLGANAEAVAPDQQRACPSPANARLRLANLTQGGRVEWLIVNPTDRPISLEWEVEPGEAVVWRTQDGTMPTFTERHPLIAPRGWLHGVSNQQQHGLEPNLPIARAI